ncbi:MAG: recombination protein RecR [Ignavibacteria bacterium]|jgi:recombination protein RecR|nr:recombination protein RecR [Ignavibacteria bacterium]HRI29995.1 recombination mediator RecR [Candidatus Kapabacteria bacterium]
MHYTSESIETVVELFTSLPSIGRKTAQRLTFYLLRQPRETVDKFSSALQDLKNNVRFCSHCFNFTEQDPCVICTSQKRDKSTICVVEDPNDVLAIEKTGEYKGLYHVLHGALNPLDGIGPNDLKIKELIARLNTDVQEIILALNPNVEGEVTTQYLAKITSQLDIKTTRIARGIPIGSDLELADEATLSRALEGRIQL